MSDSVDAFLYSRPIGDVVEGLIGIYFDLCAIRQGVSAQQAQADQEGASEWLRSLLRSDAYSSNTQVWQLLRRHGARVVRAIFERTRDMGSQPGRPSHILSPFLFVREVMRAQGFSAADAYVLAETRARIFAAAERRFAAREEGWKTLSPLPYNILRTWISDSAVAQAYADFTSKTSGTFSPRDPTQFIILHALAAQGKLAVRFPHKASKSRPSAQGRQALTLAEYIEHRNTFGPEDSNLSFNAPPGTQPFNDMERMLNELDGIPVPIPGLDLVLRHGLRPTAEGGLVMRVSGRPGAGKTSLGLALGAALAPLGTNTIYISCEERDKDLASRITSIIPPAMRAAAPAASFDLPVEAPLTAGGRRKRSPTASQPENSPEAGVQQIPGQDDGRDAILSPVKAPDPKQWFTALYIGGETGAREQSVHQLAGWVRDATRSGSSPDALDADTMAAGADQDDGGGEDPAIKSALTPPGTTPLLIVLDGVHEFLLDAESKGRSRHSASSALLKRIVDDARGTGAFVLMLSSSIIDSQAFQRLDHLVDIVMRVEVEDLDRLDRLPARRLVIEKTRRQSSQTGSHVLHLSGSRGLRVSPNVTTQLESELHRTGQDRDHQVWYDFLLSAEAVRQDAVSTERIDLVRVHPGSHVFVSGQGSGGKTGFGLKLLTSRIAPKESVSSVRAANGDRLGWRYRGGARVLVVSFLSPESFYSNVLEQVEQNRPADASGGVGSDTPDIHPLIFYPGLIRPEVFLETVVGKLKFLESIGAPANGVLIDGLQHVFARYPYLEKSDTVWPALYEVLRRHDVTVVTTYTGFEPGRSRLLGSFELGPANTAEGLTPTLLAIQQEADYHFDISPALTNTVDGGLLQMLGLQHRIVNEVDPEGGPPKPVSAWTAGPPGRSPRRQEPRLAVTVVGAYKQAPVARRVLWDRRRYVAQIDDEFGGEIGPDPHDAEDYVSTRPARGSLKVR